jgi:hypothetical protein
LINLVYLVKLGWRSRPSAARSKLSEETTMTHLTVWPEDGADRVGLRIQGTDEIAQELTDLGVLRGAAHRFEGEGT